MQRGDGLHAHDDVLYLDECHDHPNLPHLCFSDHLTCHSKKENKIYILRHPPVSTYIIQIYCQNPTLAPTKRGLSLDTLVTANHRHGTPPPLPLTVRPLLDKLGSLYLAPTFTKPTLLT